MTALIKEIFRVAVAQSIGLYWKDAESDIDYFYENLATHTRTLSLLRNNLKAGKRLEIDALNGAIVRRAAEKGVPVPLNKRIVCPIKIRVKCFKLNGLLAWFQDSAG